MTRLRRQLVSVEPMPGQLQRQDPKPLHNQDADPSGADRQGLSWREALVQVGSAAFAPLELAAYRHGELHLHFGFLIAGA